MGTETIEPLHVLPFDGVSAYALTPYYVINPSAPTALVPGSALVADPLLLAIAYWPLVLGTLLAIVLAFVLWRVRVVLARPQRVATPYCRRCNYDLSALVDGTELCTECGANLNARGGVVLGRAALRRLRLLAVPLLGAGAIVALGIALGAGWRPADRPWASTTAQACADAVGLKLDPKYQRWCTEFFEVQIAEGTKRRAAVIPVASLYILDFVPGGKTVIGTQGIGQFWRFDVDGGGNFRQDTMPDYSAPKALIMNHIVGATPDGASVYVMRSVNNNLKAEMWRWDLADDSTHKIEKTPGYGKFEQPSSFSRAYSRVPGERERFFSCPGRRGRMAGQPFVVAMHTGEVEPAWTLDLGLGLGREPALVFAPDGSRAYISGGDGMWITAVDLESGESLGSISMPPGVRGDTMAIDPTGRYLVMGGSSNIGSVFAVRDTERREWIGWLRIPGATFAYAPYFSSDGHYLVAAVYSDVRKTYDSLAIWDISSLTAK